MKKNFKINLRISYNSPVILTFCLLCTLILFLDKLTFQKLALISNYFTVPGSVKCPVPFNFKSVLDYIKLFTHVLGHSDWNHLVSNLTFILLIGPLLEERYGSPVLALMIVVTALVTGVLNACLIPSPLHGASGIAFMLIILASFTSISKNEIPLSFVLVFIVFLGSEIFLKKDSSNISVLAHVAGGLCGSMFGFLIAPKAKNARTPKQKKSFGEGNSRNSDATVVEEDEYLSNYKPKKPVKTVSNDEEIVLGTIEL